MAVEDFPAHTIKDVQSVFRQTIARLDPLFSKAVAIERLLPDVDHEIHPIAFYLGTMSALIAKAQEMQKLMEVHRVGDGGEPMSEDAQRDRFMQLVNDCWEDCHGH